MAKISPQLCCLKEGRTDLSFKTFKKIFHLDKQRQKGKSLFPSHPKKGASVFQQSLLTFRNGIKHTKWKYKRDCKQQPCPYLCAMPTGRVRPEWEHTWNQLQMFPNTSPAPKCASFRLCAGCSPPFYNNARRVSPRSNKALQTKLSEYWYTDCVHGTRETFCTSRETSLLKNSNTGAALSM